MQCACAAGAVLAVPAFWIIIKDDDLDLLIGEGLLVLCVIAYGAGLPSCEPAHPRLATFIHETFIQTFADRFLTHDTSIQRLWSHLGVFARLIAWLLLRCAGMVFNTPRRCRYTVIGLGYNLSHATLGGTAPMISTLLFSATGTALTIGVYFGLLAALCGVGLHLHTKAVNQGRGEAQPPLLADEKAAPQSQPEPEPEPEAAP